MALELNGTTGVSLVQDGVVTAADLASGAITSAALPAGSVLQVVQDTYATEISTSSTSFISLGLSATINISSSSNSVLAFVYHTTRKANNTTNTGYQSSLFRGATEVFSYINFTYFLGSQLNGHQSYQFLDSPATTGNVTYSVQGKVHPNGGAFRVHDGNGASTLILMEIAG